MVLLAAGGVASSAGDDNWPHWRGPLDNGSTEAGGFPVKWDADKVLWKAKLPGKGCSTPIVWNRRIYLTAPTNGLDSVLAFDWSGKQLWETTLGQENAGKHRNGSGCNPSPATDGRGVFVYFKSGTLAALEFDGRVRWQTNLVARFGPETFYWDHGSSPVLTEKYVVMARMHHGESWLAAFDKASGQLQWLTPRNYQTPTENDHGYGTPLVIRHRGQEALLVWGAQHLTLYDTTRGTLLWTCAGFDFEAKPNWPTVASLVVAGDVAVLPFGRSDRGQPRLYGVKLGTPSPRREPLREAEPGQDAQPLWERADTGTFVPTPALYHGGLYIVRDRGEVECLDPFTGATVWKDAFPRTSANFYASPVIAGGHLYAAREDGAVFVGSIERKFELLAENEMSERVIASPVPVAHRLLIRGEQHLFCVDATE
jgi:outer membrane protein assembly factor BamB